MEGFFLKRVVARVVCLGLLVISLTTGALGGQVRSKPPMTERELKGKLKAIHAPLFEYSRGRASAPAKVTRGVEERQRQRENKPPRGVGTPNAPTQKDAKQYHNMLKHLATVMNHKTPGVPVHASTRPSPSNDEHKRTIEPPLPKESGSSSNAGDGDDNEETDAEYQKQLDKALEEDSALAKSTETKSFDQLGKEIEHSLPKSFMDQFLDPFRSTQGALAKTPFAGIGQDDDGDGGMHSIRLPTSDPGSEEESDTSAAEAAVAPALPVSSDVVAAKPIELTVKMGPGATVNVVALPSDTVADVGLKATRKAISKGFRYDPGPIKFRGELLEDHHKISAYHLHSGTVVKMSPHPVGTIGAVSTQTGALRHGSKQAGGGGATKCPDELPARCKKWLRNQVHCEKHVRVSPELIQSKNLAFLRSSDSLYTVWKLCPSSCARCGDRALGPGNETGTRARFGAPAHHGAWWKQMQSRADMLVQSHYDSFFVVFICLLSVALACAACLCCSASREEGKGASSCCCWCCRKEKSVQAPYSEYSYAGYNYDEEDGNDSLADAYGGSSSARNDSLSSTHTNVQRHRRVRRGKAESPFGHY
jgi:hypothetical protein